MSARDRWLDTGLCLVASALVGCGAQVWDFDSDASVISPDANAANEPESSATVKDASVGVPPQDATQTPPFDGALVDGSPNDAAPVDSALVDGALGDRCALFETDCARAGLHCLQLGGLGIACVPCTEDSQCSEKTQPRCDPQIHRCVACESDSDCGQGEVCVTSPTAPTYACAPSCLAAPHACPIRAAYCDPVRSVCVSCLKNSDCQSSQVCDVTTGECVDCSADSDCPNKLMCDRTTDKCVQCLRNSDCGKGLCNAAGTCVAPWWDE